ncbi:uncharacterized protein EV154DRAFT_530426 [Mucor mucedo]|uniref:uncharacterized protein n=1 Tax=Mucor mucedo TaxID=29922 RepID=UPI0022202F29|nr:uncharacterized protein EV154DRAFT_530426 [Mucor mucedo]KAI7869836.1 hypothetical protein EV154DRAFT_530426 [Mucor mucedo]
MKLASLFKDKGDLWKKIFKCAVAYEIATILILIPSVLKVAGSPPYLVPLGTIFFNASGTAGNQIIGMLLNTLMMLLPAIWCGIVSFLCAVYNRSRETNPALYSNGAGAIASIGFSICVLTVAYVRLKYPRLYIPALQGFTIPFFALTKGIYGTHFDIMIILGSFYPVLWGGLIALMCNLLFWPETAAKTAEQAFGSSIESMKDVLSFVHEELLKNDNSGVITNDVTASTKLQTLTNKLQKDIGNMKSARKEAKYELIVSYYTPKSYKPLLHSISSLAENLFGFSLAIKREVKAHLDKLKNQQMDTVITASGRQTMSPLLTEVQSSILSGDTLLGGREYKNIDRLQSSIQPSLKRFISTCILTLDQIEKDLIAHKAISIKHDKGSKTHSISKINLVSALEEFKETETTFQDEYDRAGHLPSEEHFLIFTVIFTMVQFGQELIRLQTHAEELIKCSTEGESWIKRIHLPRVEFKNWLSKTSYQNEGQALSENVFLDSRKLEIMKTRTMQTSAAPVEEKAEEDDDESFNRERRRVSELVTRIESRTNESIVDQNIMQEEHEKLDKEEYEEQESVPLHQTPGKHIWNRKLYSLNKWFQYAPTRYAIKFTITMQLLALMAFLPFHGISDIYSNNHGQWALLSAMVVINYTVGSTTIQCFYRIISTIIGAVCGYLCLLAANRRENPYVIGVLVLVFQVPMWYLLLGSKFPRIGFISLLTMSVIVSTGYISPADESIFYPVWIRTVTAILATIVVMLVDQLIWPVWARKRLRTDLADLLITTGIQYARVVSLMCQESTKTYRYQMTFEESKIHQKKLNRQLNVVQEMWVLAKDEPRLTKGPFPIKEYQDILEHERNILHWIQHILATQAMISERIRKTIMTPMNAYRKEMSGAVHLYLFTLACSLRTKSSLPATLPSAELARRMLQTKQTALWKQNHDELLKQSARAIADQQHAEHQLFWHTYAAGCTEVVVEQESMGELVARLMGQCKGGIRDWQ